MAENLGNIEYHKGWVLEKNPEPEKLHNKFAWAEKHGVQISIGPNDIGEGFSESLDRRLNEMFIDDEIGDQTIETIDDVKNFFKNELFHNKDAYSKNMRTAMAICIHRLHESDESKKDSITLITEFLEDFVKTITTLNESEETDKVVAAINQKAEEARKIAKLSIERGIAGNMPRLEFDKVEQPLMTALQLFMQALRIAHSTANGARAVEFAEILNPIQDALVSLFQELHDEVEKAYKTSRIKIYHSCGTEMIVKPEELNLKYYLQNFVKAA